MTHGERMARVALAKWLDLYQKQLQCQECIGPKDARCHKHRPEIVKLIKDTKLVLATGPN